MALKESIYKKIRTDLKLRQRIAASLKISDTSVYIQAERKSIKLELYKVVKIIIEHTGLTDSKIIEDD